MEEPNIVTLPRLNAMAPNFTAKTTHGDLTLSDYKGKWVVLFSHPADFTPVCTTEFIAFAKKNGKFEKLNTKIIGLSIDSVYSHLAWVRNIKDHFDVEIPFPVIADLDMNVAKLYGMVHPEAADTSAVRAVFVIDDMGILRAMVYYPLTNGRSVDEILRIIEALQTSIEHGVATPENWKPGDKVIVPPPSTQEDAEKRKNKGYEYTDWYFSKKEL
jgi:peroxiredoxin (alkyl hydroperoxide reductase subunit C)